MAVFIPQSIAVRKVLETVEAGRQNHGLQPSLSFYILTSFFLPLIAVCHENRGFNLGYFVAECMETFFLIAI